MTRRHFVIAIGCLAASSLALAQSTPREEDLETVTLIIDGMT